MRVATFNINNINKRLDNLLAWLAKAEPDVVSLQELKAEQDAFPVNALRTLGYEAVWQGERSWNGVAILARNHVPVLTCTSLPGNPDDHQARYIEAALQGVLITSIYLPNGNPQPGPKFNYKLAWFERLIAHAAELMASGAPVVLAGDYNVVPTPHDIYPTRSLDNNALIQPESRQAFARLLAQGWTDAMRKLHPDGPLWTFWDYKFERWQKDKGMRLDHFLLSPKLSARLVDGSVDRWARGQENASDHAPTWITLDLQTRVEDPASVISKMVTILLEPESPTNYRGWWNNPWNVVEESGQPQAGSWTEKDEERLVKLAHARGLWIRFYTLDGATSLELSCYGWFGSYSFGSLESMKARWRAAYRAGVDYIVTDQYEQSAEFLKTAGAP